MIGRLVRIESDFGALALDLTIETADDTYTDVRVTFPDVDEMRAANEYWTAMLEHGEMLETAVSEDAI